MSKPLLKTKVQTPVKNCETQVISNGRYTMILAKIDDHVAFGSMYAVIHNIGQRPGTWVTSEAKELIASEAAFQKMDYEGYELMENLNGLPVSFLTNGCVDQY